MKLKMKTEKKIVVNASALRSGGALTILRQFISEVPADGLEYLIFVDKSVSFSLLKNNIQTVQVNTRSFIKRFFWDICGLKKWLKRNHVVPLSAISLQNTNFRLNQRCPNYIYYHQSLPFYQYNWSFLKKSERSLWFYKIIYPFFVALFLNRKTEVFVQLEFVKQGFVKKFNFDANRVHVVFPNLDIPSIARNYHIAIDENALNLFYPADAHVYKNHQILFEALALIDKMLKKKVILYLTVSFEECNFSEQFENVDIVFLGKITHQEVMWMFHHVDTLLFPSYVETLGLPLIEAASVGLPVFVSDLPYSREVLDGYEGAVFISYNNANDWALKINELSLSKSKRFVPYTKSGIKSWDDFFAIIKNKLQYV